MDILLESLNAPNYFIRHKFLRGWTDENDGTNGFRADATFRLRPGLADSSLVSLESFNFPNAFLRFKNNRELWLGANDGSDLFKREATFHKRSGVANPSLTSFEAFAAPGSFIRHMNFGLFVHQNDGSALFNEEVTWKWRTNLNFNPILQVIRSQRVIDLSVYAYYFDSGDSNSMREMGLFCAEIPSKV